MRHYAASLSLAFSLLLTDPATAEPDASPRNWLMPGRGNVAAPEQSPPDTRAALQLLREQFPELGVSGKTHPGTSPRRAYQKEAESLLARARQFGLITEARPATLEVFPVIHADVDETRALLSTLVPDLRMAREGSTIVALGSPASLDQMSELLAAIDLSDVQVMNDFRLVEVTPREPAIIWTPGSITERSLESVNGQQLGKTKRPSEVRIGRFPRSH